MEVLGLKRVESGRNRRKLRSNAFKYLAIERRLKEGNHDKGEMEMREVGGFNLATFHLTLHYTVQAGKNNNNKNKGHFTLLSWVLDIKKSLLRLWLCSERLERY